jgi:PhnB protein
MFALKENAMSPLSPIPEGHHTIQPYLIFKNTAEAIDFYVRAFGAVELLRMADPKGRIGHAEIQIGDSCLMMADEHPQIGALSAQHYGGSPISLMAYVEDCDAVYKQALAAGATSTREPADQPYGDRMAGVKDPFGYSWYLGTRIKEMSREELEQLMK